MGFQYLTNTPLDEARKNYIDALLNSGYGADTETVSVQLACGRVTARAVYAKINAPHYPASAMDGIALMAAITAGATETTPVTLKPEQFVMLDTGDPLPDSADAVVMIEDVIYDEDGNVKLYASASPWQHIRQIGEDICAGEMILPSYTCISPAAIGAMLEAGVMGVEVLRRPVVGIIPTGDEIVMPTANPGPGDIIEFNSSIFSAILRQWDAEPVIYPIVADKKELIRASLDRALSECDIVIINAGSSAGREDYSASVIADAGEVVCHGIAIRPGKPAILGLCGSRPVTGVPGYPVSGILVLDKLIKPVIDIWYHREDVAVSTCDATLSRSIVSGLKYEEFVRTRLGVVGGRLVATPLNRGSGVVTSFMKADGIITVPQNVEGYESGDRVDMQLLRSVEELENTLVAIGSHDPLLDELADMMRRADPRMFMSSSHVGSMGGIMAMRRGETHIAGVHLLDETDGSYNVSYIEKYFPNGGVRLVECVGRT